MSGGFVVKDSSEGGAPSAQVERSGTRKMGTPSEMPEGILDDVGGCKPPLPPGELRRGAKRRPRVRDVQGAEQSRGYSRGTERERSPEQPGPKGNALCLIRYMG